MKLGKTETETSVEKITQARNIVKEIIAFEVSETQKIDIIYFLALELEDVELMKNISHLIKKHRTRIKPQQTAEYGSDIPNENNSTNNKLLGV